MSILLPALAVAFAACCVWLTVRAVNRREQWAKWMLAMVVGVPVLYAMSFGPACWIFVHEILLARHFIAMYRPVLIATEKVPAPVAQVIFGYAELFAGREVAFEIATLYLIYEPDGLASRDFQSSQNGRFARPGHATLGSMTDTGAAPESP